MIHHSASRLLGSLYSVRAECFRVPSNDDLKRHVLHAFRHQRSIAGGFPLSGYGVLDGRMLDGREWNE